MCECFTVVIYVEIHNEQVGLIFQIVSVHATGSLVQLIGLNVLKYLCLHTDIYLFVVNRMQKEAPVLHVGPSTTTTGLWV